MPEEIQYAPSFRVAVAFSAMQAKQSEEAIARTYGVTVEQVHQWKNRLIEGAVEIFTGEHHSTQHDKGISRNELAITIAENSTQGFAMMDEG